MGLAQVEACQRAAIPLLKRFDGAAGYVTQIPGRNERPVLQRGAIRCNGREPCAAERFRQAGGSVRLEKERPLTTPLGGGRLEVPNEDAGVRVILNSIASLNVQDVGRQVLEYLNAGYSGDRLLHEMGRVMLWDDTNTQILPTLRTVFEEWERSSGSDPARTRAQPSTTMTAS